MKRLTVFVFALLMAALRGGAQEAKTLPAADERYKADILLVVAHPDDEGAATPYLARALDEGKHVAVVFGTRGSSGANEAGAEQAAALGAIREIEARRALALLGITNVWFLGGKDTASQNVLQSLANREHAEALEQLVRLVRLTRPEVCSPFCRNVYWRRPRGSSSGGSAGDGGGRPGRGPECFSRASSGAHAAAGALPRKPAPLAVQENPLLP